MLLWHRFWAHVQRLCAQNFSHSNIFKVDVHRTLATATVPKSMCTELKPQPHVQSRCTQNLSHSNICQVDVHRTSATATCAESMCTGPVATATVAEPMCTEPQPQQHVPSQGCCAYDSVHISSVDVAVAKVLCTSALRMRLWLRFGNAFQFKHFSGHPKTLRKYIKNVTTQTHNNNTT